MKYSAALISAAATIVAAQSMSDLPQCGVSQSVDQQSMSNVARATIGATENATRTIINAQQWISTDMITQMTCINNMLGIATSSFGCGQGDVLCYCREPNFGYGVRDCANEACGASEAATVIAFGTQYCQQALASASPSPTSGASALSVLESASAAVNGSDSAMSTMMTSTVTAESNSTATDAAAAAGISPVNGGTSGYAVGSTTLTAGGDALTTSGVQLSALPSGAGVVASANDTQTTLSGSAGLAGVAGAAGIAGVVGAIGGAAAQATDSAGNAISSASSSASGAVDSASSSVESAVSSASEDASSRASSATDRAASATSSAGEEATGSSSESGSGGAMQTAAPMLMGAALMLLAL
jgi:hypothetical protein